MLGPLNSLSEVQTFHMIWYMNKPCIYLAYCWTSVKSTASVVFRPNSCALQMERANYVLEAISSSNAG